MLFYRKNKCRIVDMGREPIVLGVEELAECNEAFRAALWTGEHLQCFLMDIQKQGESGQDFGFEGDQFYFCIGGIGTVSVGEGPHRIRFKKEFHQGYGVWIPSGSWFHLVNDGKRSLKLLAVVSPPKAPHGTFQGNP